MLHDLNISQSLAVKIVALLETLHSNIELHSNVENQTLAFSEKEMIGIAAGGEYLKVNHNKTSLRILVQGETCMFVMCMSLNF